MTGIDFPSNPGINEQFSAFGNVWIWNGSSWRKVSRTAVVGAQGNTGQSGSAGAQGAIGPQGSTGSGAQGGSANATLVSHDHSSGTLTATGGEHTHSYNQPAFTTYAFTGGGGSQRCQSTGSSSTGSSGSLTMSVSGSTGSEGSSATNANLPPYYALCYIMKS